MSNNIERKDLYSQLPSVKKSEHWAAACQKLGLLVCRGSKHLITIRNPKMPLDKGRASLITVIPHNLNKQLNESIFKQMLKFGVRENDLWRALDMM